jgi:hypothetical protein
MPDDGRINQLATTARTSPSTSLCTALGRIASTVLFRIAQGIRELGTALFLRTERALGCLVGRVHVIEQVPAPIAQAPILPLEEEFVPVREELIIVEEEPLTARLDRLRSDITHVIGDNCNILFQLISLTENPFSFTASEVLSKNMWISNQKYLSDDVYIRKLAEIDNELQSLCDSPKSKSLQVLKLIEDLQSNQHQLAQFIKELS